MASVKQLDGRLEGVWRNAGPYPAHLLTDGGEGLCLFSARFYGANDAIHMHVAGMELTLVDTSERVIEMGDIYGAPFALQCDAWTSAQDWAAQGSKWDAVSVDTYTGDATTLSLANLELWCSLSRRLVTATHVAGQEYVVPDGWTDSLMERRERGGVNWLVLTRA